MQWNNIIFSSQPLFRITRHITFWLVFFLWLIVLSEIWIVKFADHIPSLFSRLPLYILSTYFTLYFLLPKYVFIKKYGQLFITVLSLSILYPIMSIGLIWLSSKSDFAKFNTFHLLKIAIWDGWGLTLAINALASALKLMKKWHLENLEHKRLQQQKIKKDLQVLKSKLNSRFVLYTLRSINHHVRNESPKSSVLIMSLSDLLSYTLYECDEKVVLLAKEIEIIKQYLTLESEINTIMNIQVTQKGAIENKTISPLTLLPLLESLFENNAVTFRRGSDILLDFNISGIFLFVTLRVSNLKNFRTEVFKSNLFLKNVNQRLTACYQENHSLKITNDKQNCMLQLELKL